jgi:homoserine kinase
VTVRVFCPATIGNVGPGFDVLGLCLGGDVGDTLSCEMTESTPSIGEITGRDATSIPRNPNENCATIAAAALFKRFNLKHGIKISFDRKLPLAGGLGSSAAASVGGALLAALASKVRYSADDIIAAALVGETAVAGPHLDNIAPCVLGGLAMVLNGKAVSVSKSAPWWIAVCSQNLQLKTSDSRAVLPPQLANKDWTIQAARTTGVALAFRNADAELLKQALRDEFAEPARASLIPNFHPIKDAAMTAGAFGCSISGAGPSIFCITADEATAHSAGKAMSQAAKLNHDIFIAPVGTQGARQI